MKAQERIKMVKCMEFIARQINDEVVFERWMQAGVADGDVEYGDVWPHAGDEENLAYLIEDEDFQDLMSIFLRCMYGAYKRGGLFCDGVVSKEMKK